MSDVVAVVVAVAEWGGEAPRLLSLFCDGLELVSSPRPRRWWLSFPLLPGA